MYVPEQSYCVCHSFFILFMKLFMSAGPIFVAYVINKMIFFGKVVVFLQNRIYL